MSGTTRWTYLDRFWLSRLSKSLCQELVLSGLLGCLLAKMYLSFSLSRKKNSLSWTWLHRSWELSPLILTAQVIFAYESKLLRQVPSGFLLWCSCLCLAYCCDSAVPHKGVEGAVSHPQLSPPSKKNKCASFKSNLGYMARVHTVRGYLCQNTEELAGKWLFVFSLGNKLVFNGLTVLEVSASGRYS